MLSPRDIEACNDLIARIQVVLKERECVDVVSRRLYLHKDGTWSQRFDMSGYSIGVQTVESLLPEFVLAAAGIEISPEKVAADGPLILGRLQSALEETLFRLQSINTP